MSRIDDGVLSQADNTAHFLGLEHALKNVEECLKRCPFLLNVLGGIVEDIFGKIGLPEYESEENFTSKRREKNIEWDSTKAHYSKFQPENRFLTYFLKPKVEKIKTKGIKGLSSKKISFTDDYCQNCIAWPTICVSLRWWYIRWRKLWKPSQQGYLRTYVQRGR